MGHNSNMLCIFVTLDVTNLDISNSITSRQLRNIFAIFVTKEVLNDDTSIDVNFLHD